MGKPTGACNWSRAFICCQGKDRVKLQSTPFPCVCFLEWCLIPLGEGPYHSALQIPCIFLFQTLYKTGHFCWWRLRNENRKAAKVDRFANNHYCFMAGAWSDETKNQKRTPVGRPAGQSQWWEESHAHSILKPFFQLCNHKIAKI